MANNTVKLAVEEATKKTTAGDGRIVRIIGLSSTSSLTARCPRSTTRSRSRPRPRSVI